MLQISRGREGGQRTLCVCVCACVRVCCKFIDQTLSAIFRRTLQWILGYTRRGGDGGGGVCINALLM